jgi:hypothetical protein
MHSYGFRCLFRLTKHRVGSKCTCSFASGPEYLYDVDTPNAAGAGTRHSPGPRAGHVLVNISDTEFLLFGGMSTPNGTIGTASGTRTERMCQSLLIGHPHRFYCGKAAFGGQRLIHQNAGWALQLTLYTAWHRAEI